MRFCRIPALYGIAVAIVLSGHAAAQAADSVARQWNEQLLAAIRLDLARPTIHARNLFHVSAAMWDAWAAYESDARTYFHHERISGTEKDRIETISYAAYRILSTRFAKSPGAQQSLASFDSKMEELGFKADFTSTSGRSPAALGNRIASTILEIGAADGANEDGGYLNLRYKPINPPMNPRWPGNPFLLYPNRWQPLDLGVFIDQSGNIFDGGVPAFLSAEWGRVRPFALRSRDLDIYRRDGVDYWVYYDPGSPPLLGTLTEDYYKWGFEMVAIWSSHLDPHDGVMIDISPGSVGNSPLPRADGYEHFYNFLDGGDSGQGHRVNPSTGLPYARQIVPRGDYARVLAEFWADGPDSETPPGHWFTIANYISDHPQMSKRLGGNGQVMEDLEWDIKFYFVLGGAMHDAAIGAWGAKGWYDYVRPISAIRYLCDQGQASDVERLSYDPQGVRLYPGKIEIVTADTTQPGKHHEHLAGHEGEIALYAWRGHDVISDPAVDSAGVGWVLAENWWPYQRPSFVTPPFAGYVSGHSTFSRAAAEVLTLMTGSPYFPGGLGEFVCRRNEFLVFEEGPSVDITLQWATYQDASDQSSLSRIWGGIHPPQDDLAGRILGSYIGRNAFAVAEEYFSGRERIPLRSRSRERGGNDGFQR